MAHSLELRVPFLDRDVFQVARSIPHAVKTKNYTTKYILRRAAMDHIEGGSRKEEAGISRTDTELAQRGRLVSSDQGSFHGRGGGHVFSYGVSGSSARQA